MSSPTIRGAYLSNALAITGPFLAILWTILRAITSSHTGRNLIRVEENIESNYGSA